MGPRGPYTRPIVHVVIGPSAQWVDAFREQTQAERFAQATGGSLFLDVDIQSRSSGSQLVADYERFHAEIREKAEAAGAEDAAA